MGREFIHELGNEGAVFKRRIYDKLTDWKQNWAKHYAVLVEGARRVGKSTVVEEFARNEYDSYILVDFSNAQPEVVRLFDDMHDLDYFFTRLQFLYDTSLHRHRSAVIFDEVQLCPKARQAIKHLVKDGRFDYIETGSLISIHKNVKDILIPSEEMKLSMYPMDYEEFCLARGNNDTISLLRAAFEAGKPLGNDIHRTLMRRFREYMLVGGMPQAVDAYINTNNLAAVDRVKREIVSLYEDDFYKIDKSGRLSKLYDNIPAQLALHASSYKAATALGSAKPDSYDTLISELIDSRTVLPSHFVCDPNTGLALTEDISRFKLYVADTGLAVTLAFKDKPFTENIIYDKLLTDKLSANLGYIYENIVAQTLSSCGQKLYYYTFPKPGAHVNYEIDFLITDGEKIAPIEVKSSSKQTHKSLDAFMDKFRSRIKNSYLISPTDIAKTDQLLRLPTYMTQFICSASSAPCGKYRPYG